MVVWEERLTWLRQLLLSPFHVVLKSVTIVVASDRVVRVVIFRRGDIFVVIIVVVLVIFDQILQNGIQPVLLGLASLI